MILILLSSTIYFACNIKPKAQAEDTAKCWEEQPPAMVDGTLSDEDSCQVWRLVVGEHAYINIYVDEAFSECEAELASHLLMPYEPTYSNMGDEGPKWTYDIFADSVGEGEASLYCDDGNTWQGYFIVESSSDPP